MSDKVTPNYYKSKSGRDVIDWCEDFGLMNDAYVFNVLKYVIRAGKKPDNSKMRDLKKALSYIARYINYLQNESGESSEADFKQES